MRRVARNPEVVIVENPAIPFPLFREKRKMAKRKRRKHRANRGRKTRRSRRVMYNRKRRSRKAHGRKSRKSRKGRKRCVGGYASFTRTMWRKHRAAYKRLGIKKAAKAIARAWRAK